MMKIITTCILVYILLLFGFCLTCQAEVVVIVNPANTDSLDAKAISKLFLGKKKSFPSAGKATVIDQKGGASKDSFVKGVLKKSNKQFKAYWAIKFSPEKGPRQRSWTEMRQ